jgi:hypothetical protein
MDIGLNLKNNKINDTNNINDINYKKYLHYKKKYLEIKQQNAGMFSFRHNPKVSVEESPLIERKKKQREENRKNMDTYLEDIKQLENKNKTTTQIISRNENIINGIQDGIILTARAIKTEVDGLDNMIKTNKDLEDEIKKNNELIVRINNEKDKLIIKNDDLEREINTERLQVISQNSEKRQERIEQLKSSKPSTSSKQSSTSTWNWR